MLESKACSLRAIHGMLESKACSLRAVHGMLESKVFLEGLSTASSLPGYV